MFAQVKKNVLVLLILLLMIYIFWKPSYTEKLKSFAKNSCNIEKFIPSLSNKYRGPSDLSEDDTNKVISFLNSQVTPNAPETNMYYDNYKPLVGNNTSSIIKYLGETFRKESTKILSLKMINNPTISVSKSSFDLPNLMLSGHFYHNNKFLAEITFVIDLYGIRLGKNKINFAYPLKIDDIKFFPFITRIIVLSIKAQPLYKLEEHVVLPDTETPFYTIDYDDGANAAEENDDKLLLEDSLTDDVNITENFGSIDYS